MNSTKDTLDGVSRFTHLGVYVTMLQPPQTIPQHSSLYPITPLAMVAI